MVSPMRSPLSPTRWPGWRPGFTCGAMLWPAAVYESGLRLGAARKSARGPRFRDFRAARQPGAVGPGDPVVLPPQAAGNLGVQILGRGVQADQRHIRGT